MPVLGGLFQVHAEAKMTTRHKSFLLIGITDGRFSRRRRRTAANGCFAVAED